MINRSLWKTCTIHGETPAQFSTLHHVDELETYQIGYPRRLTHFLWKCRYVIGKAWNFFIELIRHDLLGFVIDKRRRIVKSRFVSVGLNHRQAIQLSEAIFARDGEKPF